MGEVLEFPISKVDFVVGQFVHVDLLQLERYSPGVVIAAFDQFIVIALRDGGQIRYSDKEASEDYYVYAPTKNGERVMAKKNIFGKYKAIPKK